ncbi:uncharacterized protein BDV14DRAFT_185257 [Aspergillus stella-maris]|uniref:uncharacterized protein n=1 Tax=Aspergillus stella-maris TaxID=1810926 RepID=UPI003CCD07BF
MSPRPPNKPDDRSYELSPTPARTKEENQERAFTAASRRKDRTLDARVESANRASMLHKKRTGRALKITRAIVAAEGMYEEIDENYDAKIQRYRKVQDAQINSDFDNSLLAGLTGASHSIQMPNLSHNLQLPGSSQGQMSSHPYSLQPPQSLASPSGPEADSRRPGASSTLLPTGNRPTNPRHLSLGDLHLSQLQISSGPKSDPLPGAPNFNVIPTPGSGFSPSYTGPMSAQLPDSLVSPYPLRSNQQQTTMPNCQGFNPSAFEPTYMGGLPISNAQYRNRIASVPNISFRQPRVAAGVHSHSHSRGHSQATTPAPGSVSASDGPTTHQHNRVRSEPGPIAVPIPTGADTGTGTDTLVSSIQSGLGPGPRRTSCSTTTTATTSDLLPTPRTTPPHTPTFRSCQGQGPVADMNMNMNMNNLHSATNFNFNYGYTPTPIQPSTQTQTQPSPPTPFKYTPSEMADVDLHVGLQISPTTMTDEEFDDFRQFASGLDGNAAHFLPMQFDSSGSGGLDFGFGFDAGAGAEVC